MALTGQALPYVPPAASIQQQIAAINRIIDIINRFQNSITFADDETRRMFIGYMKDGWGAGKDFGIKVSRPGVDVMKASDNQLLFKMDLQTWSFYDPENGRNFMQIGILPNGQGGTVVAKEGFSVNDAFTQ